MTADEARDLQSKPAERKKGKLHKLKLAWLCGVINDEIKNAACAGKNMVRILLGRRSTANYASELAGIYENLGYFVAYSKNGIFVVVWNFKALRETDKITLTNHYVEKYEYFTRSFLTNDDA